MGELEELRDRYISTPQSVEGEKKAPLIASRLIKEMVKAAPRSLAAHALLLMEANNDRMRPARHHLEVIRVLEDRKTFPGVVIVQPPGYAKSSWGTIAYGTWRLGASAGNIHLGLISNTASQAYAFSKAMQSIIESPMWHAAYPEVRPDYARGWSAPEWYVTGCPRGPNPSVLAAGIGGPVVGKRFTEIILDDPTKWEEARSVDVMEKQRNWLKNTLLKRFPAGAGPPDWPNARMTVLTTRWSENDLVPTLAELGFTIVRMPALGYWDRTAACEACGESRDPSHKNLILTCEHCGQDADPLITYGEEALWPEAETAEQLRQERHSDEIIFELVKQGNTDVLAGTVFESSAFQRGFPPEDFEKIIMCADTAGGKDRRKGDYFALVTIGQEADGKIWVLDVIRERLGAPDQERAIVKAAELWQPDRVGIEDANEGRAVYQHLNESERLPLKLITPKGDKEFRIIPLANAYRAGRMFHPEGSRWVRTLEAEMEAFPNGAHDDMCDALAHAYNLLTGGSGFRVRFAGKERR